MSQPTQKSKRNNTDQHRADSEDTATCEWGECGAPFTDLSSLVEHIHIVHIGSNKSNYTCEWSTCLRRGVQQTSRTALITHIRSHTGEKPFICTLPECDRSFTRLDALHKHTRQQHNILPPNMPPPSGRGGSRKRKRGGDDASDGTASAGPSSVPLNTGTFNTFKIEPTIIMDALVDDAVKSEQQASTRARRQLQQQHSQQPFREQQLELELMLEDKANTSIPLAPPPVPPSSRTNGRHHRSPSPLGGRIHNHSIHDEHEYDEEPRMPDSPSDVLPDYLARHFDAETGLVLGRTPAMAMYLIMKSRLRYANQQHEELRDQLNMLKSESKKEKELKESALDMFLKNQFGEEAEKLVPPPPIPIHYAPSGPQTDSYQPYPHPPSGLGHSTPHSNGYIGHP
ncbi:hypothetical protein FA15DRAFT_668061 [Coprinopsis marcescibilis]|uniref:C2H2-type domain-containing protein n=1 Tax=Coprinopsis marcescibilis TaxID=230819 RepID=A0A5C3L056_COPMA|nr:hypothetical protein FA15DRAFT_668061 [Coprinopsis marcescibilis]